MSRSRAKAPAGSLKLRGAKPGSAAQLSQAHELQISSDAASHCLTRAQHQSIALDREIQKRAN